MPQPASAVWQAEGSPAIWCGEIFHLTRREKSHSGLAPRSCQLLFLYPMCGFPSRLLYSALHILASSPGQLFIVLPADLYPKSVVGAVAGMVGFGGAMGGIAFGQLAGYLLDRGLGYTVVFSLAGTFHVIAFLVILILIPAVQPLVSPQKLEYQATT